MAPPQDQSSRRRALGKGLETLLPTRPATPPSMSSATGQALQIEVDAIDRNPFQTRTRFDEAQLEELAASIRATGVIQPIVVRSLPHGRFQLITGERRLLASKKAGKSHIPSILAVVSDEQSLEMTIVENLQRADLNPMEQARAYRRLASDFKMTQEQMALRTGKERASVANFLRLLRLPESVQTRVESGELSFGHARTLLALETPEAIESATQRILAQSLSVRQTETYVQGILKPAETPVNSAKMPNPQDPNVREAQQRLQSSLGLKVRVEDHHGKGRVIIDYNGIEDFDAILSALASKKPD